MVTVTNWPSVQIASIDTHLKHLIKTFFTSLIQILCTSSTFDTSEILDTNINHKSLIELISVTQAEVLSFSQEAQVSLPEWDQEAKRGLDKLMALILGLVIIRLNCCSVSSDRSSLG